MVIGSFSDSVAYHWLNHKYFRSCLEENVLIPFIEAIVLVIKAPLT